MIVLHDDVVHDWRWGEPKAFVHLASWIKSGAIPSTSIVIAGTTDEDAALGAGNIVPRRRDKGVHKGTVRYKHENLAYLWVSLRGDFCTLSTSIVRDKKCLFGYTFRLFVICSADKQGPGKDLQTMFIQIFILDTCICSADAPGPENTF
jgi:hypothetical protein